MFYEHGFITGLRIIVLFCKVMSFDRYVAIVHPVSAKWRKIRTRYNANIVTLVVSSCLLYFALSIINCINLCRVELLKCSESLCCVQRLKLKLLP